MTGGHSHVESSHSYPFLGAYIPYFINHCRGWLVLGYEILPANLLLSRMEHPPFKVMFFPARKLHWLKIVHCNVWYPSNAHPKSTLYQLYPHDTISFDGWTSRIPICVTIPIPGEPVIDLIQSNPTIFPFYPYKIPIKYSHVLCPYMGCFNHHEISISQVRQLRAASTAWSCRGTAVLSQRFLAEGRICRLWMVGLIWFSMGFDL